MPKHRKSETLSSFLYAKLTSWGQLNLRFGLEVNGFFYQLSSPVVTSTSLVTFTTPAKFSIVPSNTAHEMADVAGTVKQSKNVREYPERENITGV